jgi:peroxiredoxin
MFVHLRKSFEELNQAEMALARLRLSEFLEPATSYLSVVELGLYDSTLELYTNLAKRGIEPHSPDWNQEIEAQLARQREAMAPRLWPAIPDRKYICFYPMDRRRGESVNWYQVPMAERKRMMHEHGMVGRRYAGDVKQIITGSIGFDDWEWGVDLFAEDPLVFKKLIYEMRFDEVSAVYALFGMFYVGVKVNVADLPALLKT